MRALTRAFYDFLAALLPVSLFMSLLMTPAQASVADWRVWDLQHINAMRAKVHVPPLRYSVDLQFYAQQWANHMALANAISHGDLPPFGSAYAIGQNVGMGGVASGVEGAFERSPSHRANEVDRDFKTVGIGIVYKNGFYWIVQDYRG